MSYPRPQKGRGERVELTHVELFSGERATTNTCGVCLDDAYRSPNSLWRYAKASANTTNRGRGRCHIWIGSKVKVEHQRIRTLDKNLLLCCQSIVNISNAVYNERLQSFSQVLQENEFVNDHIAVSGNACLVPFDLAFCIIFEMAITFEATLYDFAEFVRECIMIKQVVHSET